jgi:hypothetical protein
MVRHTVAQRGEETVMPKVFSMHPIRFPDGVTDEEFERFVTEEMYLQPMFEGWDWYLLKGIRGEREGKTMIMFETESPEAFNRYYPLPAGSASEETRRFWEANPEARQKWTEESTKYTHSLSAMLTNYIVVAK